MDAAVCVVDHVTIKIKTNCSERMIKMGLFSRKKKERTLERKSIFDCDFEIDKSSWFEVFSACLGKMMAVQDACSEMIVKNRDWNVDFSKGVISFGNDEYPIQFIGSESSSSGTWLWGWKNINGFNDNIIKLADSVRQKGEEWNLEPLLTDEFHITDTFNGHSLSIVACGILKENLCYYRGPHSGGAILVAFYNVPDEVFAPVEMKKFIDITMQCIQQFQVDHKIFIESFLLWNGTKYEWNGNSITAHFEQDLCIEFEEADQFFRISGLKTI